MRRTGDGDSGLGIRPVSTDASLDDLRVVSLRTAAAALAVAAAGLLVVLSVSGELAGIAVVLAVGAVLHGVVAAMVGRRWTPTPGAVLLYLLVTTLLIGAVIAWAPGPDTSTFALLLVPVGVGGVVLAGRPQTLVIASAAAIYTIAADAGGGATTGLTLLRILSLAAVGGLVWLVTSRLESALATADAARRVADARAARMEVVARVARAIETSDPEGIVAATLAATSELGWPHAALVLAAEDGTALVESRGFPLPDAPVTGAIARAMRLGITLRPSPDDDAVRDSGLGTVLVAPVRFAGAARGALLVGERASRVPDRTDDEALALLAAQVGRSLEVAGRLERELQRVEDLEERGRERDDFLSIIAHELRTPLTAIIGLAETVRRLKDRLPDERRDDLLARMEANTRALEGIVTSMLDLARMERGTFELLLEPVDLSDVVDRTVRRLEPLLVQHEIQLRVDPLPATVLGDARLIERVVENLLTNASRHTPAGTRIVAATRVNGREVALVIADDGPGMSEADLRRLGERFHRGGAAQDNAPSGVGLGLSLVREVLRLHGSELEVETAVGVGTVFSVRLPRTVEVEVELDLSGLDA